MKPALWLFTSWREAGQQIKPTRRDCLLEFTVGSNGTTRHHRVEFVAGKGVSSSLRRVLTWRGKRRGWEANHDPASVRKAAELILLSPRRKILVDTRSHRLVAVTAPGTVTFVYDPGDDVRPEPMPAEPWRKVLENMEKKPKLI